jgi:hypothetical protein
MRLACDRAAMIQKSARKFIRTKTKTVEVHCENPARRVTSSVGRFTISFLEDQSIVTGRAYSPPVIERWKLVVPTLRLGALVVALGASAVADGIAQSPPLVFTVAVPDRTSSETTVRASTVIEERGLALWSGTASNFGIGVDLAGPRWTVHSITSMTTLPVSNYLRPTFQQVEVVRSLFSTESASIAGGGGVRQEWDGTRVLVGRVLAGTDLGRGRLQGSLVMERAVRSLVRRDPADVVMSLGWSRRIGDRLALGVEGIGQDLEGFWDSAEADGGAKLLVGPSLHLRSRNGEWSASAIAGPVVRSSLTATPKLFGATPTAVGNHFGIFASASWLPSMRRPHRDPR